MRKHEENHGEEYGREQNKTKVLRAGEDAADEAVFATTMSTLVPKEGRGEGDRGELERGPCRMMQRFSKHFIYLF